MLVIDQVDLKLITHSGRREALAFGDGDHVKSMIADLFCERYRRQPYTDEEMYSGKKYQAIGSYSPKEGEHWQLKDGRQLLIVSTEADQVKAAEIKFIGLNGAPGFYSLTVPIADFDGARNTWGDLE